MSRISEFIRNEYRTMVGYVRNRIEDEADREAEDIVQDVIVHLFDRVDLSSPIENLAAYIYSALRNKIVDTFRKRRERVTLSDTMEDTKSDVNAEVENRELIDQAFRIMDDLAEEEKAVILATEFEGWNYQELSKEWNIPEGTLMARKKRALDKIRKRMKLSHNQK